MTKENENIISELLNVHPIQINSNLVSGQNRKRLYWTNIKTKKRGLLEEDYVSIPLPKNKNILFKDIIENGYVELKKSYTLLCYHQGDKNPLSRYWYYKNHQGYNIVFNSKDKIEHQLNNRELTPIEMERLQTFPDNYTAGVSDRKRTMALANSFTVDVISHILGFMEL